MEPPLWAAWYYNNMFADVGGSPHCVWVFDEGTWVTGKRESGQMLSWWWVRGAMVFKIGTPYTVFPWCFGRCLINRKWSEVSEVKSPNKVPLVKSLETAGSSRGCVIVGLLRTFKTKYIVISWGKDYVYSVFQIPLAIDLFRNQTIFPEELYKKKSSRPR